MKMKYFLMAAAIVVATSTTAMAMGNDKQMTEGKGGKEMTFEEKKAKMLENMGKRIAAMQKKQSCVQAAATKEALQACFPNMDKAKMKEKKEKMKDNKGGDNGSGQ